MYKFTNGVVVYDKATKDKYIKAGMILVSEEVKEEKNIGKEVNSKTERREYKTVEKKPERLGKHFR